MTCTHGHRSLVTRGAVGVRKPPVSDRFLERSSARQVRSVLVLRQQRRPSATTPDITPAVLPDPVRSDRITGPAARYAGPDRSGRSVGERPRQLGRIRRQVSGDKRTDHPGDRAPLARAGPATGGTGRAGRSERSHSTHRAQPKTERSPRWSDHVHGDRSPCPPEGASSIPLAGSPGHLKSIYITLASKMITNHTPAAYWTQGCRK